MTVDRESWHARLYRWWYFQKYGSEHNGRGTNLCPYMRAILFWSWMRWLFLGGRVWRIPVPVVSWLFLAIEVPRWLGIVSYDAKRAVIYLEAAFALCAAGIFLLLAIIELRERYGAFETVIVTTQRMKKANNSFWSLVGAYLRSAHDRVCPEITIH